MQCIPGVLKSYVLLIQGSRWWKPLNVGTEFSDTAWWGELDDGRTGGP